MCYIIVDVCQLTLEYGHGNFQYFFNNIKRRIVIVYKLNTIIKLTNILNQKDYNSQMTTREVIRRTVKCTAENDLYIKLYKFILYELQNTGDFITNLSI